MKHFLLSILLCPLLVISAWGQTDDIVQTDGITGSLHQANIGKITFMSENIPLEKYKEADFLATFELKKENSLNIRVFLKNSITNYMHQLAPDLTEEQLNVKGNFQFSFFVDDIQVYKENIHYGCGLKKSTTTTFRVPLTDAAGGDWWSVYLFNRFMMNGGEQALTDGVHKFKIEMRPYVKINENDEAKVGEIIASGELNLIIKTPKVSAKQIAIQPIQKISDFQISRQHYNKKVIEDLNKNIATHSFKDITSIVVLKDGKLLIEEYFNGANRNTIHDTRSIGKSFTSALMGIAIKDGHIKNENQYVSTFYDQKKFLNYSEKKDSISLKNLLTMSSSLNGSDQNEDSPGHEEKMYPSDNWVKFTLDLPIDSNKFSGKQWDYFTAGVVLLGDILNMSVPGGLEKYADERLFKPLAIENYKWQYTPQNVANTAGGLQMRSIDYAKFGQLYKNKGLWNGKQILSAEWVDKTFTRQMQIPERPNEFYGFLFWNKTYTVEGKNYETYYCAGNGGSKIFIFKDIPVTIVITAKAYNRPYGHPQVDKMMENFIIPALIK